MIPIKAQNHPEPWLLAATRDYKMDVQMDVKNTNTKENKNYNTPIIHQIHLKKCIIICIPMPSNPNFDGYAFTNNKDPDKRMVRTFKKKIKRLKKK